MTDNFRIAGHGTAFKDSRGLWTLVIELPQVGGKRRRKYLRSTTKEGLRTKVRKFHELRERTGEIPGVSPTVEQWMQTWLDTIAETEVRPKTLANYRSMTKHIIHHLGKTRLDDLTPSSVRRMDRAVANATSSTTALTVHSILSSALASAETEGKVVRNVARLVKPPRRNHVDLEVLTTEEAIRLIRMFRDSPERCMWAVFLLTGARRGEILGLEWDRITDAIDLSWQLQRHQPGITPPVDYERRELGHGLYLTRPKSRAGVRVIPLFPELAAVLSTWRSHAVSNPHNLVFTMPDGSPIDPDYASRKWRTVLRAAGITRRVRLHDVRHTTVDLLYEAGVHEDIIRDTVGHSTRTMTRAYRSRASKDRLAAAMEPFSTLVSGKQLAIDE